MAILKLNGRTYFINRDAVSVAKSKSGAGRYTVTIDDNESFDVIGGRNSGGSEREWFCLCPRLFGDRCVPAKSMIGAIRMGAGY